MIILGIDPGLARVGYGVIQVGAARQRLLDWSPLAGDTY